MFHDFFNWIKEDLGRFGPDGQSWSNQLHESLFMWNVIEGTHVLTLMFFAGTIWLIDLRMMGVAFKNMPFSKLNDRVLPITAISFAVMIITGLIAFIGRDPIMYYHNIWFRLKMIFLIIAAINIFCAFGRTSAVHELLSVPNGSLFFTSVQVLPLFEMLSMSSFLPPS